MDPQAEPDDVADRNDWPTEVNVHPVERKVSRAMGVGLLAFAGLRRGLVGASAGLLGAALLHRGTTGHCHAYSALRVSTAHGKRGPAASVPHGQGVHIRRAVVVPQSAAQVYRFWRSLANLPIILHGIDEVLEMPDGRSHWRARGPLGVAVEWEATIINDVEGELIAWRTLAGSQFNHAGSLRFATAVGGAGTLVTWTMEYDPPAGLLGAFVARMLGTDPARAVEDGLRRLKLMLAASEVAGKQPEAHVDAQIEAQIDETSEILTGRDVH
jgi:uncharacterized membrane protein